MIKKLKRKVLFLATSLTFALMAFLVSSMNIINYTVVVKDCDDTLTALAVRGPKVHPETKELDKNNNNNGSNNGIPNGMSPEVIQEARFFVVTLDEDNTIILTDFSRILTVDETTVNEFVDKAMKKSSLRGFVDDFRYLKNKKGKMARLYFLDCGRKLHSYRVFAMTSSAVGLLGIIIFFLIFLFFSGKIVKPIIESYEKQKRFISDAGHEIKTPLTIINANLDLLETEGDQNEELDDIRVQTNRLTQLTYDLVSLSKIEEFDKSKKKSDFPLSETVLETAKSFMTIAATKKIDFTYDVSENITMNGIYEDIKKLVSILLDNAMKYTNENGKATLSLFVRKKQIVLSAFNTTSVLVKKEDLSHVFECFYRSDASRNSETGGSGIGLSIAEAVVLTHNGTIQAETHTGHDFIVTAVFPMK